MKKYSPEEISPPGMEKATTATDQEAVRKRRIAATIADGIAIQDRFKAEPLLKSTGRGSYRSDLVAEVDAIKKTKNVRGSSR